MITLDFNLLFTVINILVLCLILKKFLLKPVTKIMQERDNLINSQLHNAQSLEEEADALKREYTGKIDNAKNDVRELMAKSKAEADFHHEKIVKAAKEEAAKILTDAQIAADVEKQKAMDAVKKNAAILAVELAQKATLSTTGASINRSAYDKFIKEAGELDNEQ